MPTKREALELAAVLAWKAQADALASAKEKEAELRAAAIALVFPDGLVAGTTRHQLADGTTLKAEVRVSAKVDQKLIGAALAKLKKTAVGRLIADRLVKWKAEASVSEFKALSLVHRDLVKDAIVLVDGNPSLEVV